MLLEGRTALVTGSGRNIGRATILAYAKEGANVVVNARSNQEEVDAVVKEAQDIGVKAIGVLADISDPASVQAMADKVLSTFGKVDILVNNAAIRSPRPFTEIDYAEWRRVISVDLDGAFHCIKAFLPGMLEQSWGRIINITGMMAHRGNPGMTHVSAAKLGMVGLTRSLSVELAPHDILVNCISPGAIGGRPNPNPLSEEEATQLARRLETIPINRRGTPEEIAGLCLFLTLPGGGYISGQHLHVNGAADRF
jgi:3-oxoacyl-[acyl-carrier protein] reductase